MELPLLQRRTKNPVRVVFYVLLICLMLGLDSCHASKTRILLLDCSGTRLPDSREGYFNAKKRNHYLRHHLPSRHIKHDPSTVK